MQYGQRIAIDSQTYLQNLKIKFFINLKLLLLTLSFCGDNQYHTQNSSCIIFHTLHFIYNTLATPVLSFSPKEKKKTCMGFLKKLLAFFQQTSFATWFKFIRLPLLPAIRYFCWIQWFWLRTTELCILLYTQHYKIYFLMSDYSTWLLFLASLYHWWIFHSLLFFCHVSCSSICPFCFRLSLFIDLYVYCVFF